MASGDREHVQSVERAFAVIQSFGTETPSMTLSEVAEKTGLTRAAARRFLLTLANLGHVGTDGKYYWLRPRVLDLGYRFLSSLPWWQVAQPLVDEASRTLHESVSACILDDTEIVYVLRAIVSRIISTNVGIGSRLPAYPTALGRVLLSQLPEVDFKAYLAALRPVALTKKTIVEKKALRREIERVRTQGYALVDEELDLGLRALAVPIVDRSGGPLGALGVSVHANRVSSAELIKRHLPVLRDISARITRSLPPARAAKRKAAQRGAATASA